ncbi:dynein regulatory complex subunit 7 [Chanos chanos]|uniref:Dynein regulatory complex subunit 7 n=1 Tax=Chanos chanos TaxID=29144 RepID=A0A6J2WDH5_CHACN|nr:dynein regulatory complex subunit 7 [Chanos chanos]
MEVPSEIELSEDVAGQEEKANEEEDGLEQLQRDPQEVEDTLRDTQITPEVLNMLRQDHHVDLSQCPDSYKENSKQEKLLLAIAENFRSQYAHLYPDRKPLLMCPRNECGVQKFVSTTLRPTLLSHPELYSWEGCASFVSEFLSMKPLEPPFDPPRHLFSPALVLQTQRGTCFDFSTLLCSLLLGAGYDAYCVSGYAVKDICLLNQSRQECPLLVPPEKRKTEEQKQEMRKYSVKPPRDLRSSFKQQQEARRQAETEAAVHKERQEAEREQEERERPPPDSLLGLRVHCWVLVLCGKRKVPENFFIDPLTGKSYATTNENFLGIESVWNHQNYWVNMQDCRFGCAKMTYDLGDAEKWEYLLFGPTSQSQQLIREQQDIENEDETDEALFEMPQSWVSPIYISQEDMESRCPGGTKVTQYRKAKLEKFAPYLLKDGLVTRLSVYDDLDCTQLKTVKEWYKNRHDHLEEKELEKTSNVTVEHFSPGRNDALKRHRYTTLIPENERQMDFYSTARVDGLASRVETPFEMTETFEDRPDFLCYRHVIFGKWPDVSKGGMVPDQGQRPLQKVVERFHRDKSKPASKDVAERSFLVSEGWIEVTYHLEDDRIIPGWHIFVKPQDSRNSLNQPTFNSEMVSSFQVDPFAKPYKELFLYEMLMSLMKEEENVILRTRESEHEIKAILTLREQENSNTELHTSIYNTTKHEKARTLWREQERKAKEEHQGLKEKERDYLAPYLSKHGNPESLTQQAAIQIRADCLADLKQHLTRHANVIQARYEKETQQLQMKQQWFQKNQLHITKEEETEYLAYCSGAMLRIRVLKQRLNRHKEEASQRYQALDEKLRRDPRLANHLW